MRGIVLLDHERERAGAPFRGGARRLARATEIALAPVLHERVRPGAALLRVRVRAQSFRHRGSSRAEPVPRDWIRPVRWALHSATSGVVIPAASPRASG